jgi:hypothetical protein
MLLEFMALFNSVSTPSQVEFVIYGRLATFMQKSVYSLALAEREVASAQEEFPASKMSAAGSAQCTAAVFKGERKQMWLLVVLGTQ